MNKWMLWALVAIYWVWPVDLLPGIVFDDIAVVWAAYQYQDDIVTLVRQFLSEKAKVINGD